MMANVTGPLFSIEAKGSISKTLCYKKGMRGTVCRKWAKPSGSSSLDQLYVRNAVKFLTQEWSNISNERKATWNELANNLNVSPFNAFIKENVSGLKSGKWPSQIYPATRNHNPGTTSIFLMDAQDMTFINTYYNDTTSDCWLYIFMLTNTTEDLIPRFIFNWGNQVTPETTIIARHIIPFPGNWSLTWGSVSYDGKSQFGEAWYQVTFPYVP